MWRFPSFESLVQDTRYAIRSLVKAPGFSVVAILVLAIGIGANTAMFSLVDAMLLRGLPYADADRLVVLFGTFQRTTAERRGNSFPDHRDWRKMSTHFEDLAAYWNTTMTLEGFDEPERIQVETVSAPYFSLLRVAPMYGRTFREDEDAVPNRDRVAVLSDGLWRRRFGSDPNIVNRTIQLGGQTVHRDWRDAAGIHRRVGQRTALGAVHDDEHLAARESGPSRLPDPGAVENGRDDPAGTGGARRHLRAAGQGVPGDQRESRGRRRSAQHTSVRAARIHRADADGRRQLRTCSSPARTWRTC